MSRRIIVPLSVATAVLGACDVTLPLLNRWQTGQWPWDFAFFAPFSVSPPVPTTVERAIGILLLVYPVLQIIGGAAATFWTRSWRWSRWVLASGAAGCLISVAVGCVPLLLSASSASNRIAVLGQICHFSAVPVLLLLACIAIARFDGDDARRGFPTIPRAGV
jgi:hypothetical protein